MSLCRCFRGCGLPHFPLSALARRSSVSPPGPTTQSRATGDFLKVYEKPRIGGDLCDGSFSETASLPSAGRFCAFFSGPEIPFPGNGDRERQRSVRTPVTPKEVRASDADETTRQACRRDG